MDNSENGALADHLGSTRGPTVTRAGIEALIASTVYHRLTDTLTVAVLTLANGFSVTGESACAAPENFNQELGEKLAYEHAIDKIWPLEGYLLKTRMAVLGEQADAARIQQLDDELTDSVRAFLGARAVAHICHEANRALCEMVGPDNLPGWSQAPEWMRDSAEQGVIFHVEHPDAGPSASHEAWMEAKIADGWVLGPVKDPDASPPTHPNLIPYNDLPDEQKAKDYLFRGIVHALWPFIFKMVPTATDAELPPRDAAPAA